MHDDLMSLTLAARKLALEIARCPVIEECLANPSAGHPCSKVVAWQRRKLPNRYTAEPWAGHLARAPLLFVSSNPSADDGLAPLGTGEVTWASSDDLILRVTDGCFDEGQPPGVRDGIYQVDAEGQRAPNWIRYWAFARARARDLLGRVPRPGHDYALTEVVHCGSKREHGTWEAASACAPRDLHRVLELSPATVIMCVGKIASWAFAEELGVRGGSVLWGPGLIAGRERTIVRVPGLSAHGSPKSLPAYLEAEQMESLRRLLA
jgi:hypothetical protein